MTALTYNLLTQNRNTQTNTCDQNEYLAHYRRGEVKRWRY